MLQGRHALPCAMPWRHAACSAAGVARAVKTARSGVQPGAGCRVVCNGSRHAAGRGRGWRERGLTVYTPLAKFSPKKAAASPHAFPPRNFLACRSQGSLASLQATLTPLPSRFRVLSPLSLAPPLQYALLH